MSTEFYTIGSCCPNINFRWKMNIPAYFLDLYQLMLLIKLHHLWSPYFPPIKIAMISCIYIKYTTPTMHSGNGAGYEAATVRSLTAGKPWGWASAQTTTQGGGRTGETGGTPARNRHGSFQGKYGRNRRLIQKYLIISLTRPCLYFNNLLPDGHVCLALQL